MASENSSQSSPRATASELLANASTAKYNRIRHLKDRMATISVAWGGISVILAIVLIFFYLLYEISPMFGSAKVEALDSFEINSEQQALYYALEEQNKLGFRIAEDGEALFFDTSDGSIAKQVQLPIEQVTALAAQSENSRIVALGNSQGEVLVIKHNYLISFPDGIKTITPKISYPIGEGLLELANAPIDLLTFMDGDESSIIVALADGEIYAQRLVKEEDMLSEEVTIEPEDLALPALPGAPSNFMIGPDGRWLYAVFNDFVAFYDLSNDHEEPQWEIVSLQDKGKITQSGLLLGGLSLMVADDQGGITQLFLVREKLGNKLQPIRYFLTGDESPIRHIVFEHRRKGFVSFSESGKVSIFYSSAHRKLFEDQLLDSAPDFATISPRANFLLVEKAGKIQTWKVDNQHPEVSWSALWGKVWYESYQEPEYIWQSSASNNDFEPKHSLMPLSFGTLKAAFYAMLLGAPLAVCGAIYTAYFMAPALRKKVKPLVELMEALPTVILGFLAGLWLAPFMETQLVGVVSILLIVPPMILVFGFICSYLPVSTQNTISEGWHAILLVPYLILIAWFCLEIGPIIEKMFFHGDMRAWLTIEAGIPFDQRNAFVVGIAMGFAVIPTIFSIAEDAIFSVPKHLSFGSLALGATPWQTLVGVVLPTASPGIFSALMIGMGRAVGETMIVLMATGNTPIMDFNIFEGMRTLSANIAVEVPEAEVGSTHYRILFLAAFVLFTFTFVVNTAAEIVRQRLRKKYGSL